MRASLLALALLAPGCVTYPDEDSVRLKLEPGVAAVVSGDEVTLFRWSSATAGWIESKYPIGVGKHDSR